MKDLNIIISEVFDIEEKEIGPELKRNITPEWDSFNHLILISEIETKLEAKFSMSEVEEILNYNDLVELVKIKKQL